MATQSEQPRRFVPTLTQVVEKAPLANAQALGLTAEMQQEIVMRVMQRLDVLLEQQLPKVVSRIVAEHMQSLGPRLWDEVAQVVERSVEQAVAQEWGERKQP